MTLRDLFTTKAAAVATLALGLSQGSVALAQQTPDASDKQNTIAVQAPANNNAKGELVTTWSPVVDPINPLGSHVPLDTTALIALIAGLGLLSAGAGAYAARKGVKGAWLRAGAGG